ncbi:MAG: sugar ABC transporter permease [Nitrososphaeria archaeon]
MKKITLIPYLLVMPCVLYLLLMFIIPFAMSLWYSFTDFSLVRGFGEINFIGIENYLKMFRDPVTLNAIFLTILFTASVICLQLIYGLASALILNTVKRGLRLVTTIYMLPMVIAPSIIALIMRFQWSYNHGLINYFLSFLGVPPLSWLGDENLALIAVILTEVWHQSPFVGLTILAGLQALPVAPYEAANIDGASRLQCFRYITVPLLKPVILVALLFRTIFTLRLFDIIFILTGGGPGRATYVLSMDIYYEFLSHYEIGYASAISWILAILTMMLSFVYLKTIYKEWG